MNKKNYRKGVGIVVVNDQVFQFFLGKRIGAHAWQFPQGGIDEEKNQKKHYTVNYMKKQVSKEIRWRFCQLVKNGSFIIYLMFINDLIKNMTAPCRSGSF